jgi:hypothetical protein
MGFPQQAAVEATLLLTKVISCGPKDALWIRQQSFQRVDILAKGF